MRKLRIAVVDLVARAPTRSLYARLMHANLAGIMPQVTAVWCEEEGHEVQFVCYTGLQDLTELIPRDIDLLILSAFTQAAQLAYAVSNLFRQKGVVTAVGGPHARCYPQDAQKYFDYVLGFTDREVLRSVLADCAPHRPEGIHLTAERHPVALPGVRERWKFIEPVIAMAPAFKLVPVIGSLGCPYACPFCIDSVVDYQPLASDQIRDDLRFLRTKLKRPLVGWHDPNFGIRFDEIMDAIEDAVPPGSIDFAAEASLSILSEPHLERMRRNGFKALLPGIESWYGFGNKSGTGRRITGMEKVRQVSQHVNLVLRYVPYVQTNFVLGLDQDQGAEPFELTKRFLDLTPGAFPAYSLFTAFGQAAPLNVELQRDHRVLGFPFHFLNNNHAMNVRPKHYSWPEFYDRLLDLSKYSFSPRAIVNRFRATEGTIPRWLNVVRAVSSEGFGRIRYHTKVRRLLGTDPSFSAYFNGESQEVPQFYADRVRRDLGPLWDHLPQGALFHDPVDYMKAHAV